MRSTFSARRRRRLPGPKVVVPVLALGLVGAAVPVTLVATRFDVTVTGLADGAVLGRTALAHLSVGVRPNGTGLDNVEVRLDGHPATVEREGRSLVVTPQGLSDGQHTLAVSVKGRLPFGSTHLERTFTVDTTPPKLEVSAPTTGLSLRDPVTIKGTVEHGSTLTADGKKVPVRDGSFALRYDTPPAALDLVARDRAGNVTTENVSVSVKHPMMRGVHMTALAWSARSLRDPILALAKAGKINTIELDIKDEDGIVGYNTQVPLAHTIGAASHIYDAKKVVDELHKMHVRLVGRLVCFRDPKLAQWAWAHGKKDMVVQEAATHQPWQGSYGKYAFTNFANDTVRAYNIDLATEAARLGFDDILYDYVRRPDGAESKMIYPGLTTTPSKSVAAFVADTRGPVRAAGAYLGVSVFGIASTRPKQVAQDIPLMGKVVDYVSPMVYPSHWAAGEYGVANPNAQPYDIVVRSLKDFQKDLSGTDAQVIPWLQDFSLGVHYGPEQVKAELRAAHDDGIDSFLLWNAGARYQGAALTRLPKG